MDACDSGSVWLGPACVMFDCRSSDGSEKSGRPSSKGLLALLYKCHESNRTQVKAEVMAKYIQIQLDTTPADSLGLKLKKPVLKNVLEHNKSTDSPMERKYKGDLQL